MGITEKKQSKSGENISSEEVLLHYNARKDALILYFSNRNPNYSVLFLELAPKEIQQRLENCIDEIEKDACLSILASTEAAFRLHYSVHAIRKGKSGIEIRLRDIYEVSERKARLEDIIDAWKDSMYISPVVFSHLKNAFKYRHWLAHGRYWVYKGGQRYNISVLQTLIQELKNLPHITF